MNELQEHLHFSFQKKGMILSGLGKTVHTLFISLLTNRSTAIRQPSKGSFYTPSQYNNYDALFSSYCDFFCSILNYGLCVFIPIFLLLKVLNFHQIMNIRIKGPILRLIKLFKEQCVWLSFCFCLSVLKSFLIMLIIMHGISY